MFSVIDSIIFGYVINDTIIYELLFIIIMVICISMVIVTIIIIIVIVIVIGTFRHKLVSLFGPI